MLVCISDVLLARKCWQSLWATVSVCEGKPSGFFEFWLYFGRSLHSSSEEASWALKKPAEEGSKEAAGYVHQAQAKQAGVNLLC